MIHERLSALLNEALEVSDWKPKAGALEKKLSAAVIDPLLLGADLAGLRRLYARHAEAVEWAIGVMTVAQLRALTKKLNPHRLIKVADSQSTELAQELKSLAAKKMDPTVKPAPNRRTNARSQGSTAGQRGSARRPVAAE